MCNGDGKVGLVDRRRWRALEPLVRRHAAISRRDENQVLQTSFYSGSSCENSRRAASEQGLV